MSVTRVIKYFSKYLQFHVARHFSDNCINHVTSSLVRIQDIETQKNNNNNNNNSSNENHIVWLDMEMTGLEVEKCHIMEIACLITDKYLKPVSNCLNIVVHQSDEILENMSDWCKKQHKKTGLIEECRSSEITLEEAQRKMIQHLENHVSRGMCPLAGNSVYMDRIFLKKYMPLVDNYLHYRIIDVSTIKELARRWQPDIEKNAPKKKYFHRASFDIKDSLNELSFFRNYLFIAK